MTSTEKLHARLASLESEYLRLVREEFQQESDGFRTAWLDGPTYQRRVLPVDKVHCQRMDSLEKEILSVRKKLLEPIPGQVVGIVADFKQSYDLLGTKQTVGEWVRLVRAALTRIDALLQ